MQRALVAGLGLLIALVALLGRVSASRHGTRPERPERVTRAPGEVAERGSICIRSTDFVNRGAPNRFAGP